MTPPYNIKVINSDMLSRYGTIIYSFIFKLKRQVIPVVLYILRLLVLNKHKG